MTMSQAQLNFAPPTDAGSRRPVGDLDALPDQLAPRPALDVEHRGLGSEAVAVGLAVAADNGTWYLPFGHNEGRQYEPGQVRRWAKDKLAGQDVVFRAAKNDLEVLRRWGLNLEELGVVAHEVQHAAALLDDTRRDFKLDTLMRDKLGRGKVELPFHARNIWERPPEHVAAYARGDARGTFDLDRAYQPLIAAEGLETVLGLEDELIYGVCHMERQGVPLDLPKLHAWIPQVQQAYTERVLELYRRTGLRVNPNSGPDMIKLFRHLGLPHTGHVTEKAQKEAFPEEALLAVAGHWAGTVVKERQWVVDVPEVQLALEARQLDSLLSKYLLKYASEVGADGLLRYQLHQLRADEGGTITGRFASSKVNIQQVKKPDKQEPVTLRWLIRELFIPGFPSEHLNMYFTVHDEVNGILGNQWLHADASQIEFRLFAHYSRVPPPHSERLIEAYRQNPNIDFHTFVTHNILKDIMIRTLAKNFNFMKLYGGGILKAMAMMGTDDEALVKQTMDEYDEAFPEAGRLLWFCSNLAERRGYIKTLLGRRRRFVPGDRYYSALNCVLQGGAADLMKLKLLRLYNERKALTSLARVQECFAVQEPSPRFMIQEQPIRVPITWDCAVGANWKEAS